MSKTSHPVPSRLAAPHWEKRGNTIWVSCGSCEGWFPVEEDLIVAATIELRCPHCGKAFTPDAAARIIEP